MPFQKWAVDRRASWSSDSTTEAAEGRAGPAPGAALAGAVCAGEVGTPWTGWLILMRLVYPIARPATPTPSCSRKEAYVGIAQNRTAQDTAATLINAASRLNCAPCPAGTDGMGGAHLHNDLPRLGFGSCRRKAAARVVTTFFAAESLGWVSEPSVVETRPNIDDFGEAF